MRFLTARRLVMAAFVPALFVFSVVPGCSNQGEGERCDGDEDCSGGLLCTNALLSRDTYRCCYSSGRVTDSRCTPNTAASSGGAGGVGGTAASLGGASLGGSTAQAGTSGNAGVADAGAAGNAGAASDSAGAGGG